MISPAEATLCATRPAAPRCLGCHSPVRHRLSFSLLTQLSSSSRPLHAFATPSGPFASAPTIPSTTTHTTTVASFALLPLLSFCRRCISCVRHVRMNRGAGVHSPALSSGFQTASNPLYARACPLPDSFLSPILFRHGPLPCISVRAAGCALPMYSHCLVARSVPVSLVAMSYRPKTAHGLSRVSSILGATSRPQITGRRVRRFQLRDDVVSEARTTARRRTHRAGPRCPRRPAG